MSGDVVKSRHILSQVDVSRQAQGSGALSALESLPIRQPCSSPFLACKQNQKARVTLGRSKSVAERELFQSAEFPPTSELTHDAESESSRRLSFSAVLATTCGDLLCRESSLPIARRRRWSPLRPLLSPELSRSRFNRGRWVNNLVAFAVSNGTCSTRQGPLIVQDGEPLNITGQLVDFADAAIPKSGLLTFQTTLYDEATETIINGLASKTVSPKSPPTATSPSSSMPPTTPSSIRVVGPNSSRNTSWPWSGDGTTGPRIELGFSSCGSEFSEWGYR